jgi:hypothetical protein
MKQLRLGDPAAVPLLVLLPLKYLHWGNLVLLLRPTGLWGVAAFVRGAVASFRFGIDRGSRTYVPPRYEQAGYGLRRGTEAASPAPVGFRATGRPGSGS